MENELIHKSALLLELEALERLVQRIGKETIQQLQTDLGNMVITENCMLSPQRVEELNETNGVLRLLDRVIRLIKTGKYDFTNPNVDTEK